MPSTLSAAIAPRSSSTDVRVLGPCATVSATFWAVACAVGFRATTGEQSCRHGEQQADPWPRRTIPETSSPPPRGQFTAESRRGLGYAWPGVIELFYESGTLVATGAPSSGLPEPFVWDGRTRQWRAPASAYREAVLRLRDNETPHVDRAAAFEKVSLESRVALEPRPYQREALDAWRSGPPGLRGVIVLPTGAGKTAVAVNAIERVGRSTLIVVPTLALLKQWYSILSDAFGAAVTVGLLGGGYHEVTPLTVTTYDSAYIHAERYGDRFALVVYDEVHHLPAPKNALIAKMLLAPYALGLTATPERPDGGHERLPELAGPVVYRRSPDDLAGTYLAPYELVRIPIKLTAQERFDYAQADAVYRDFLRKHRLSIRSPEDWQRFVLVASTSHSGGREALLAARRRREIRENAMRKGVTLETASTAPLGRSDHRLHQERRGGVRAQPTVPDPRRHLRNPGQGAQGDPGPLPRGPLPGGDRLGRPERGRRRPRRGRRRDPGRQRLPPRVRPAPGPHPASQGGQARHPLRAGRLRHRRGGRRPPPREGFAREAMA